MWTEITGPYDCSNLRYATDVEWSLITPYLPVRRLLRRPREADLREGVNAIFYMLRAGCPWSLLPEEFPSRSTVQLNFYG